MSVHHFFVSYSRLDAEWVNGLVDRLRARGNDVWLDQTNIPASVPWMREIEDAITEAYLVVRCDSADFRASTNCGVELELAQRAAKPQFTVAVGEDLDACVRAVEESAAGIAVDRRRRTELRVLARDWDRAGRRAGNLVGARQRRRLARVLSVAPPVSQAERAFLRASLRRSIRRTSTALGLVVAIVVSSVAAIALFQARQRVEETNRLQAHRYATERDGLDAVEQDVYAGLSLAARYGGDEAQIHAAVITAAMRTPTPDDAFTVPAGVKRFVVAPVSEDVVVADPAGHQWHRLVARSDTRTATANTSRRSRVPAALPRGYALRRSSGGVVRLLVDGVLRRSVTFDAKPAALALSPNGRLLAAAVNGQIDIADLSTGDIRLDLRGGAGPITDVAWSTDGRHVWAVTPGRVVAWPTGDAVPLLDNPAESYSAVLPATDPARVWAAARHELVKLDTTDGRIIGRRPVDDEILSAGAAPDGTVALVSGRRHAWVVPLAGAGEPRPFDVPGCRYGRPTFRDAGTAYLPCLGGKLATVSVRDRSVPVLRSVTDRELFGSRAVPGTDQLFVGDAAGGLYAVRSGASRQMSTSACAASLSRIAVSPRATEVLAVGAGSGYATCTQLARRPTAESTAWTFDALLESSGQSILATAVTFNRTGSVFAIGYSDGTVTLRPTGHFSPSLSVHTVVGAVRDLLALPDGNLIIATTAGLVQKIAVCDECLSNSALAKVAAQRLETALRLGLAARNDPGPSATPGG